MRGIGLTGLLFICACGGLDEAIPADGSNDAPEIDGPTDAPVDTPNDCGCFDPIPAGFEGRIGLFEIEVLDPRTDGSYGQGLIGEVVFNREGLFPEPVIDTNPGTPFGCKLWTYTRPQALAAGGLDEGTVRLQLPPNPAQATCDFENGAYDCPGLGITPGSTDPGLLPDSQAVNFSLTAGGGNEIPSFNASLADVGNDFTLPAADLARLENIPRTGEPFTIACDPAVCPQSAAIGNFLEIITTDAPTAGLSPFAMPDPVTQRVVIRCAEIGAPSFMVPESLSAYLASPTITRIQTSYRRVNLAAGGPSDVMIMGGHGITGITN